MAILHSGPPYFWVTWVTRLLSGEDSCEWSSWFRAHHEHGTWEQAPSSFDPVRWQMDHTAALSAARDTWEGQGCTAFTERQNCFALRGESATLGGRPDLIARRDDSDIIIDVKTGRRHPSHVVQVMLYMYAVPRCIEVHRGVTFSGQVAYSDGAVDIPAHAVDEAFVRRVSDLLGRLGNSWTARRVPSTGECAYCPITVADCPERMEGSSNGEGTTTDF